jgi:predicted amidophosphoribosyltransferase
MPENIPTNEGIEFMGKYFPYWVYDEEGNKSKNPKFDAYSGNVLNLKNRQEPAVKGFSQNLKKIIPKGTIIAIVPSHDPAKKVSGIRDIAHQLIKEEHVVDGTECLKRNTKIPKLASGGNRNLKVHLGSIIVENTNIIKGKTVFLLDDVTTTGNSLLACKKLLETAGAKAVKCYALGKTTWE